MITAATHHIYLIRFKYENCNLITTHINKELGKKKSYRVIFCSKGSIQHERVFERAEFWSDVTIREFKTMMIPISNNLLSMEYSKSFRKVSLDQYYAPLSTIADPLIESLKKEF